MRAELARRDETAEPVVKRVHRDYVPVDPIRGLFEARLNDKRQFVEYEPDTELRDTEQIALTEEDGIEGFLRREVLPYAEDAWYVEKSVKVGYEISFNRYFYKPEPMRSLEEIRADILAVERETEGLLEGLVSGVGVGGAGFAGASWEGAAPWTTGGLAVREPPPRAAKLRVYIDTSVIGGCEDEGFRGPSRRLIERCMRGEVKLVVSAVTAGELRQASPPVRQVLRTIDPVHLERVEVTRAVENLANAYIESGALGENMRADALHIATATVAGVDVLASWNFRHMVNLRRIHLYNAVNRRMGHGPLDIRTPRELGNDE